MSPKVKRSETQSPCYLLAAGRALLPDFRLYSNSNTRLQRQTGSAIRERHRSAKKPIKEQNIHSSVKLGMSASAFWSRKSRS